ncbi:MAG: glycosyltransferase [Paracoccaceae bacterium]|nr:glycosyltransferase [Paracoccaceae bacterium]
MEGAAQVQIGGASVPSDQTPSAAVVIPHYNDTVRLRRCLDALMAGDLAGVEVVVVDNGSTEALESLVADFPAVRFVIEPEKGAAPARNRGVAETVAPLLMFIDSDCVPAPDWVARARAVSGRADVIGGRVDVFDETPPPRSGAEAFETVFAFNFRDYIERQGFTGAGNMVTRREVFLDVGGFRNGLSEDREWSLRATAKGHSLAYADDLRVSHPTRPDWPALRRKWLRLTQETWGLYPRTRGARIRWALRAGVVAASGLAHQPKLWRSPRLSGPGERWRGAVVLMRIRLLRAGWMLRQAVGWPV